MIIYFSNAGKDLCSWMYIVWHIKPDAETLSAPVTGSPAVSVGNLTGPRIKVNWAMNVVSMFLSNICQCSDECSMLASLVLPKQQQHLPQQVPWWGKKRSIWLKHQIRNALTYYSYMKFSHSFLIHHCLTYTVLEGGWSLPSCHWVRFNLHQLNIAT